MKLFYIIKAIFFDGYFKVIIRKIYKLVTFWADLKKCVNEMLFSILTGFAAGALHVVSGADHLVAMAPSAIKKPSLALLLFKLSSSLYKSIPSEVISTPTILSP